MATRAKKKVKKLSDKDLLRRLFPKALRKALKQTLQALEVKRASRKRPRRKA